MPLQIWYIFNRILNMYESTFWKTKIYFNFVREHPLFFLSPFFFILYLIFFFSFFLPSSSSSFQCNFTMFKCENMFLMRNFSSARTHNVDFLFCSESVLQFKIPIDEIPWNNCVCFFISDIVFSFLPQVFYWISRFPKS